MKLLLDTNILVRLDDQADPMHDVVRSAVESLDEHGHRCVIVPQVLYEYWVVATRPKSVNGLGLDLASTIEAITEWMSMFQLLLDERGIFGFWLDLVKANAVTGKNAHDARLVAAMQRHGITTLLTFNFADFVRYSAITVYRPQDVLSDRLPL